MMLFGVSVISERNNILTLKKLEFVLQANQWRRIFVTLDTLLHCEFMLLTTEKQEVLQSADYLYSILRYAKRRTEFK